VAVFAVGAAASTRRFHTRAPRLRARPGRIPGWSTRPGWAERHRSLSALTRAGGRTRRAPLFSMERRTPASAIATCRVSPSMNRARFSTLKQERGHGLVRPPALGVMPKMRLCTWAERLRVSGCRPALPVQILITAAGVSNASRSDPAGQASAEGRRVARGRAGGDDVEGIADDIEMMSVGAPSRNACASPAPFDGVRCLRTAFISDSRAAGVQELVTASCRPTSTAAGGGARGAAPREQAKSTSPSGYLGGREISWARRRFREWDGFWRRDDRVQVNLLQPPHPSAGR